MSIIDPLTLLIEGVYYGGFERASVKASSDAAYRSFEVSTNEHGAWPIQPQDEVEVLANEADVLVKGFVEDYHADLEGRSHTVTISGSSKSVDLVDSAAKHDTGRFRNATLKEIGDAVSKELGVKIVDKTKKGLKKIERFQLQNGETCFDALERIARSENLMLVGAANGDLEIWDGPDEMSEVALVEGFPPVLRISVKISAKDRHQKYVVRGQRPHTDKPEDLEVEATSEDQAMKRPRTHIVHAEGDIDEKRAKERADNEKQTHQGRSISASVTTTGFYSPEGKLWKPLQQLYVSFPTVQLDQTMAIQSLTWRKENRDKTVTELELVDPKAVKSPDGDSRGKSGSPYSLDKKPDAQKAEPVKKGAFGRGVGRV